MQNIFWTFLGDSNFARPNAMTLMSSSFCTISPRICGNSGLDNQNMICTNSFRTSSACSMQSQPVRAIPTLKRHVTLSSNPNKKPSMRDRSSSFNVAQQPQPTPSKTLIRTNSGPTRRNSTSAIRTSLDS
jgi:hypothetical protein